MLAIPSRLPQMPAIVEIFSQVSDALIKAEPAVFPVRKIKNTSKKFHFKFVNYDSLLLVKLSLGLVLLRTYLSNNKNHQFEKTVSLKP